MTRIINQYSSFDMMFKETQRFNQWWIWAALIILQLGAVVLYLTGVIQDPNDPIPGIVALLLPVIPIIMFLVFRLDTKMDEAGIAFRFIPFVSKSIGWDEIQSAEVLDYGFVGGWGIRLWTKYGTAYNIRGSKGMAIQLISGKKLLIGTQKPEEMMEALIKLR